MDDSVAPMSNPFGYQNSLLMAMTETEGVFETMDSVNGAEASFTIQKDGRCLVYLTGSIKSVRAAITTEEEHVVETAFDSLETPQIIDLGDVKEGDVAFLIGVQSGQRVTVDTISRMAHTINNETLSSFAARLPRLQKRGNDEKKEL